MSRANSSGFIQSPAWFASATVGTNAVAIFTPACALRLTNALYLSITRTAGTFIGADAVSAITASVAVIFTDATCALLKTWFTLAYFRCLAFATNSASAVANWKTHLSRGIQSVAIIAGTHLVQVTHAIQATNGACRYTAALIILDVSFLALTHARSGAVTIITKVSTVRNAMKCAVVLQSVAGATNSDGTVPGTSTVALRNYTGSFVFVDEI